MNSYISHLYRYCRQQNIAWDDLRIPIGSGMSRATFLRPATHHSHIILACHSLGGDRYYPFTELFIDLLAQNYAVFTLDLDGHGKDNDHYFSYPHAVNTLPNAVNYLMRHYGVEKKQILLFGHSLGGAFCLHGAGENLCGGLITVAAPHFLETHFNVVTELMSVFNPNVLRQLKYYTIKDLLPAFSTFKREEFPCRVHPPNRPYIQVTREILEEMSLLTRIKQARVPLLQIHGRLDRIVPHAQARQIHENYSGTSELLSLDYDTHFTCIFSNVARRKIRQWLSRHFL